MKHKAPVLALLLALLMLFFAVPKLMAWPVSVMLFERINTDMGWQGNWFRILTGVVELATGLLLLAGISKAPRRRPVYTLGLLMLAGTMLGALVVEVWLRPGEDWILTLLAAVLLGTAAWLLRNQLRTRHA